MTDQVLDILKLVLLALLYLFFARVLWAVWSEVRQPATDRAVERSSNARATTAPEVVPEGTPTAGTVASWRSKPPARATKPPRGKGGVPARLVVLEPKERRGEAFVIAATAPVTIGREGDNAVVVGNDTYVSGHHATVSVVAGHPRHDPERQSDKDDLVNDHGHEPRHGPTQHGARRISFCWRRD